MIAMNHAGEARQVGRKTIESQRADGVQYAVVACGKFWEVRRRKYSKGWLKSDQLVSAIPDEREADEMARYLVEKERGESCPTNDLSLSD